MMQPSLEMVPLMLGTYLATYTVTDQDRYSKEVFPWDMLRFFFLPFRTIKDDAKFR